MNREMYRIYPIKKSNGKKRWIYAPCPELKMWQSALAKKLELVPVSDYCYGFKKGVSIRHATEMHTGKRWVIKIDIKDFFPSITRERLSFLTEREQDIATLDGRLVQGSPCSPIISNIVMAESDEFFHREFQKFGVAYSRYADDITLSGNDEPKWDYVQMVSAELSKIGLRVNQSKVRFLFNGQRQEVLGIVVNEKPSIDRRTRRLLRAKIHQRNLSESDNGMLAFINSVNTEQYMRLLGVVLA